MRARVIAVVLAGCSVEQLPPEDPNTVTRSACFELEGMRFESVGEHECGLGPDGVALCKWSVTFAANDASSSTFTWRYSDVGEAGHVACQGDQLFVDGVQAIDASHDAQTGALHWQGVTYTLAP